MNKFLQKFQKKPIQKTPVNFTVNERVITISPISFEKMLEVVFLILPYLKMVKIVKEEYKTDDDAFVFFDVIENLLLHLDKENIVKALSILLNQDIEFTKTITHVQALQIMPLIIDQNDLIETFYLLRELGAFS